MIENWDELLGLFGTNDGSLPDIELTRLSGEEVIEGYEFVRNQSGRISSTAAYYWSLSKKCEVPVLYSENPAKLVVTGEAECFHVCFGDTKSPSGKRIPELGLFVYDDSLSFDYRMGPDWDQHSIEGLFEFISTMIRDFKFVEITHKSNINDQDGAIFERYWTAYQTRDLS